MYSQSFLTRAKHILLPCLLLGSITGMLTGGAVYAFKLAAAFLNDLACDIYRAVAAHPLYIPLLAAGLAVLATASWLLLRWCPAAKGGGIPSAIGVLRGILHFRWLKTMVATIASACVSFAAGLPLGTEGPSVQIGTALGCGVTRLAGEKGRAWGRYLMTSGAGAGFTAATCAPVSGLFFALEEAHKRFSPMILMGGFAGVLCAGITVRELTALFGGTASFIEMATPAALLPRDLWLPVVIGVVTGGCAVLYSLLFRGIDRVWSQKLAGLPLFVKVLAVFLLCGAAGLINPYAAGSGHAAMEAIFAGELLWQMLLPVLLMKFVLTLFASNTGVTGGMFIPILTIGALVGGLLARVLIALGVPADYYLTIVVIASASFMAAAMHTPVTALLFSVEALCGLSNVLYIGVGVFFAYLVMEALHVRSLTDMMLARRIADQNHGKTRRVYQTEALVREGAFAAGKSMRDLLLPDNCLVLRVARQEKVSLANGGEKVLRAGDRLQLRYASYDEELAQTRQALCDLFGKQEFCDISVDTTGQT